MAGVDEASLAIVSVPDDAAAIAIVSGIRAMKADCHIIVRCRYESNVAKLRKSGAERVVSEEAQASDALLNALSQVA